MALLADRALPAVAPPDAVEASRSTAAPELAPVSPYVHLQSRNEYQWQDTPRESGGRGGESDEGGCGAGVDRCGAGVDSGLRRE